MRRARLIRHPEEQGRPVGLEELAADVAKGEEWETILDFRHRYDDQWFESLIAEAGLKGKRLKPGRLRKLIVMALERRREESS